MKSLNAYTLVTPTSKCAKLFPSHFTFGKVYKVIKRDTLYDKYVVYNDAGQQYLEAHDKYFDVIILKGGE